MHPVKACQLVFQTNAVHTILNIDSIIRHVISASQHGSVRILHVLCRPTAFMGRHCLQATSVERRYDPSRKQKNVRMGGNSLLSHIRSTGVSRACISCFILT